MTKEAKLKETLKMALRNVSRLSRLVDSLMDFTRIEAGKLLGKFRPSSRFSLLITPTNSPRQF